MGQARRAREAARIHTVPLGQYEHVASAHHAEFPKPVPGQHLWTLIGMWRIDPATLAASGPTAAPVLLDHENLVSIEGPGCFWCEQPYSPDLAAEPCAGEP